MSEENIEAKQQFLRSQIIDQGYNPDDFSTFMGTIKGEEGLNIESWSLEDLKLVVNQYKLKISELQGQQEQQTEKTKEEDYQNNNHVEEMHENVEIENSLKNNIVNLQEKISTELKKFPKDPFEEYEEIIKTIKLENNNITENNNLFVTISNPVKKKWTFFFKLLSI